MASIRKGKFNQLIRSIIKNIYHNNKHRIKIRLDLSEEFCNTKDFYRDVQCHQCCSRYIDVVLRESTGKYKLMGLKTGKDYYAHNFLSTDDQVITTQGVEDTK
jgi:hypothetical protein